MPSFGNYQLANLGELPLNGFAEQYRMVSAFGLSSDDTRGEICEDAEENSNAIKEVLACLSTMRSVGVLRNLCANFTIFDKL
jgi:hypothetical protein